MFPTRYSAHPQHSLLLLSPRFGGAHVVKGCYFRWPLGSFRGGNVATSGSAFALWARRFPAFGSAAWRATSVVEISQQRYIPLSTTIATILIAVSTLVVRVKIIAVCTLLPTTVKWVSCWMTPRTVAVTIKTNLVLLAHVIPVKQRNWWH